MKLRTRIFSRLWLAFAVTCDIGGYHKGRNTLRAGQCKVRL